MHIKDKDLNLLAIFEAVMQERNVSRAAAKLHLSQSALSHALARLREMFVDDLFVRTPRGVVPTPRAMEVYPKVLEFLQAARNVFSEGSAFDPLHAEGVLRIASTEYIELLLWPRLLAQVQKAAPRLILQSLSTQGELPKEKMEQGLIDLAIAGFFGDLPDGFHRQALFSDTFQGVVREGHPILQQPVTLDRYLAYHHMLISPQGNRQGLIDDVLKERKRSRRVVAGVASFLSPAWMLPHSDLVLTAPSRLVESFKPHFPVATFDLPFASPEIHIVQVWHDRMHRDPMHRWFRGLLPRII